MSVLLIKNDIHAVINMFDLACLVIAHLLVKMEIAFLLQDRVEFPVVFAVKLFDG